MALVLSRHIGVVLAGALALWWGEAAAQVYAYPNQGQSQEQQTQDQNECHSWAVQQTGFDPNTAVRPAPASHSDSSGGFLNFGDGGLFDGGGALGDTATGAGIGAIGGALAGNTAVGAGVGALSGLLFGEINRSSSRNQQQTASNQQAQYQDGLARYKAAYSSCMTPKGYSVQ